MKTMKSQTNRAAKAKAAPRPARVKPVIDYPQDSERLESPVYTLRINAPGAVGVSVAVDQAAWTDCRESVGYWWYDWTPEASGEHELIACARYPDGRETVSEIVHCFSK